MSSAAASITESGAQPRAARPSQIPPAPALPTEAVVSTERKGSRKRWIVGLLIAAALAGGGSWYAVRAGHVSTDDAQIDAELVAIPAKASGTVAKLYFAENQQVKAGELLAELDDSVAKAKLAQSDAAVQAAATAAEAADADVQVARNAAMGGRAVASASLRTARAGENGARDQLAEAEATQRAAEASLAQATLERDRSQSLMNAGAIAATELEQKQTSLTLARAQLDAASARLQTLRSSIEQAGGRVSEASARAEQSNDVKSLIAQAEARARAAHAQVDTARAAQALAALELTYTKLYAPHAGIVSKKVINEGQAVSNGQAIAQLVRPGVWVTANFKETQVGQLRPGQKVTFTVDAYPGNHFAGHIQSFSGATGSRFALLPPDNASGNFTKVVQRVPVRVKVDHVPADVALLPGMSVDIDVDTAG